MPDLYTRSQETSTERGMVNASKRRAESLVFCRNRMHHWSRDLEEEGNMTSCTVKFASGERGFCFSLSHASFGVKPRWNLSYSPDSNALSPSQFRGDIPPCEAYTQSIKMKEFVFRGWLLKLCHQIRNIQQSRIESVHVTNSGHISPLSAKHPFLNWGSATNIKWPLSHLNHIYSDPYEKTWGTKEKKMVTNFKQNVTYLTVYTCNTHFVKI